MIKQPVEMRQAVALMAVDDQITFAIGAGVDDLLRQLEAAQMQLAKILEKFVVIAGDVGDLSPMTAFAEQFLNQDVVFVAPKPFVLQLPAVNQVANDVKVLAFAPAQKLQQSVHLRVAHSQMNVRNPNRTIKRRLQPGLFFFCWQLHGLNRLDSLCPQA